MTSELIAIQKNIDVLNQQYCAVQKRYIENKQALETHQRLNTLLGRLDRLRQTAMQRKASRQHSQQAKLSQQSFVF